MLLRRRGAVWWARAAAFGLRIARRFLIAVGDPPVSYVIGHRTILLPLSHELPFYRKQLPGYSANLGRIAKVILAAEPDLRVIDVGANVGDSVATIWEHGRVPVLCIEGDSLFFDYLTRNTLHLPQVSRAREFVGEHRSRMSATVSTQSGSARLRRDASGRPITIVTLPDVISQHPDFAHARLLKIDTDGMDTAILMGSVPYLESAKPVVFFEYDPDLAAQAGDDPRRALEMLKDIGFRKAIVYENTGDYLASVDLRDESLLADLHSFFSGRGGARYADICVFHAEDFNLWALARESELTQASLRRDPVARFV